MTTARAATLYGAKDLRLEDRELAPLAPGFVRVRFAAGGICGSDMHYFSHGRIGNFIATSPLVLGHEVAGIVEEIGEGVTGVAAGDRVAVNPSRWCGHCPRCREGRAQPLREHLLHGLGVEDPAHAGRLRHPLRRHPRPSASPSPTPCPSRPPPSPSPSPSACTPSTAATSRASTSAIIGAGPIGLLTLLAARMKGASETTMVDIAAAPLAFATRLGADRGGRPLQPTPTA